MAKDKTPLNDSCRLYDERREWDRAALALVMEGWALQAAYQEAWRRMIRRPQGK